MNTCSNCQNSATNYDVLHVIHRGAVVAMLCTGCTQTAAKPRITLCRDSAEASFSYEQYVCIQPLKKASDVHDY